MRFRLLAILVLSALTSQHVSLQADTDELLISEVFYDTPGTDGEEEWIEIINVGAAEVDLSEIKIGDEETFAGREGMAQFPDGASIEAGQVVVVAQTAVGFQRLHGGYPDYEIQASAADIPNMRAYSSWASGEVALANDGDEVLILDGQDTVVDAVNYGESTTYFAPSVSGVFSNQSIARIPADCDTDTAGDWQPTLRPTPGEVSYSGECQQANEDADDPSLLTIGEIQGEGDVSPYVNQIVTFQGVVTGFHEDQNARGIIFYTLFVQDLPGREDGNPLTSDGMAVFLGRRRPSFSSGDTVLVKGQVTEFYGLTEVDDNGLQIVAAGEGILSMPVVPVPVPDDDDPSAVILESVESMLVKTPDFMRVVGPTHSACGFAVVDANHRDADISTERILRRSSDDRLNGIVQVLHVTDVECSGFPQVKTGDIVSGVSGPLTFHFDLFKIVQQDASVLKVDPAAMPEPPLAPTAGPGQFSIATVNFQDYFDAIDDTGRSEEPKPSTSEISVKEEKLAHLIGTALRCPTIIGVQEVENAGLLIELAKRLEQTCGYLYEVSHRESADARGIDVALLSDPQSVVVLQTRLQQGCTDLDTGVVDDSAGCSGGESPLFSRPPLQVDLAVEGQTYSVFVNHFKSKREGEAETVAWRRAQAGHINSLLDRLLATDDGAHIIVLGDFNDYEASPTMQLMTSDDGRLTNVLLQVADESRYSYIFDGASQLIDGILVSSALVSDIVDTAIMHVNADFPVGLSKDVSVNGLPYRSTDHDPALLILALPAQAHTGEATQPSLTPTRAVDTVERGPFEQTTVTQSSGAASGIADEQVDAPLASPGLVVWFVAGGLMVIVVLVIMRRIR